VWEEREIMGLAVSGQAVKQAVTRREVTYRSSKGAAGVQGRYVLINQNSQPEAEGPVRKQSKEPMNTLHVHLPDLVPARQSLNFFGTNLFVQH
jgi:hypothetical protein